MNSDAPLPVTIAKMITLRKELPITVILPSAFIKEVKTELNENSAVLILSPQTKILRLIPIPSGEVSKVEIYHIPINSDKEEESFVVKKFRQIMKKKNFETLYFTGTCAHSYLEEKGEKFSGPCPGLCFSEFYFSHTDTKKLQTVVKELLEENKEVKDYRAIGIK
jgi:hypothetical protein